MGHPDLWNWSRLEAGVDAEAGVELVIEDAEARAVGLEPFAVEDELGDGTFTDVAQDLFGGFGVGLDVDLAERDSVGLQVALGLAAVAAPRRGIHDDVHASDLIVIAAKCYGRNGACTPITMSR